MKKKGFTLVELLVTIVILGIISGLSIPLLRALSNNRTEKQYKTYLNSLVASAKLYNDSYSSDLFGNNENGCEFVTFQELVSHKLLKDIMISNISCNSDYSKVRILKYKGQYYYTGVLGCGADKNRMLKDEDREISYKYPDSDISCTGNDKTPIEIKIIGEISELFNKKKRRANVRLRSSMGINPDISLSYAWSLVNDYNSISSDSWKKVTFENVPTVSNQDNDIKNQQIIVIDSNDITTPSGVSGKYYLFVRIDTLQDIFLNSWVNAVDSTINYISAGPFSIDNVSPTFNGYSLITTEENSLYNNLVPRFMLDVTDDKSDSSQIKMCFSIDEDKCEKKNNSYLNYSNYLDSFDKQINYLDDNLKISDSYDNNIHKVYVTVADLAGNYKTQSIDYKVADEYKLTYDDNGGSGCSSKTKKVHFDEGNVAYWGKLCVPTRTNYAFVNWKNLAGEVVNADTVATSDIKVKAEWRRANFVTIKYNLNGGSLASEVGSGIGVDSSGNITNNGKDDFHKVAYGETLSEDGLYNYNNKNAINIVKSHYHIEGGNVWNTKADGTGKTFDQTSVYSASDFCDASAKNCSVTLYAMWTINLSKVKYHINGGVLIDPHGSDITVGSDGFFRRNGDIYLDKIPYGQSYDRYGLYNVDNTSLINISRSGFTIDLEKAWNDGAGSTYSQTRVYRGTDLCDSSNGNCEITLYANWIGNSSLNISVSGTTGSSSIRNSSGYGELINGVYVGPVEVKYNATNCTNTSISCNVSKGIGVIDNTTSFDQNKYTQSAIKNGTSIIGYQFTSKLDTTDLYVIDVSCTATGIGSDGKTLSYPVSFQIGNGWVPSPHSSSNVYEGIYSGWKDGKPLNYNSFNSDWRYYYQGGLLTNWKKLYWFTDVYNTEEARKGDYHWYYFYTGNETQNTTRCYGKKNYMATGWCIDLPDSYNNYDTYRGKWFYFKNSAFSSTQQDSRWYPDGAMLYSGTYYINKKNDRSDIDERFKFKSSGICEKGRGCESEW